jgi:ribonucleoside-triphosphate reductase
MSGTIRQVWNSDGISRPWNREKVAQSIIREVTSFLQRMEQVGVAIGADERPHRHHATNPHLAALTDPAKLAEMAESISVGVDEEVLQAEHITLTGPLIRELASRKALQLSGQTGDRSFEMIRRITTRLGVGLPDSLDIGFSEGFEANENANLTPSPESVAKKRGDFVGKDLTRLLFNLLQPGVARAFESGDIHVHDAEYFTDRLFCASHDPRWVLKFGFWPDGTGRHMTAAGPPRHATVAALHIVKMLIAAQSNFAGGQGANFCSVFLAPYLQGLDYDEIRQIAQLMIYEISTTFTSRGSQPVFSSFNLSTIIPKVFQDAPVVMKGKVRKDLCYADFRAENISLVKAFFDVLTRGDSLGKMINFPKAELVMTPELWKEADSDDSVREVIDAAVGLSAKFGGTYYDNICAEYRGDDDVSCMQCCAYAFSTSPDSEYYDQKVEFEDGAHFSMGGEQVVSINLPRIGIEAAGDWAIVNERLRNCVEHAASVFDLKRRFISAKVGSGLIPFYTWQPPGSLHPFVTDADYVPILGIVGLNEFVQAMTGSQLHDGRDALRTGMKGVLTLRRILHDVNKGLSKPIQLARTPAESTAQRFAVADLVRYDGRASGLVKGDVGSFAKSRGSDAPVYYTNGCMPAADAPLDIVARAQIEAKFFPVLDGGNISHIFLGEAHPDPEAVLRLIKKLSRTEIGYFTITKDLTLCPACNTTLSGNVSTCTCGNRDGLVVYSRITGYFAPVGQWVVDSETGRQHFQGSWNAGKLAEYNDRHLVSLS